MLPYIQFYGLLCEQGNENHIDTQDIIPPYPSKGLIFQLEENRPVWIKNPNFDLQSPMGYFMPQCTLSYQMQVKGRFSMLAVLFKPGMFRRFFEFPPLELTNQMITYADFNHKALLELQERLLEPYPLTFKFNMIESYLQQRLSVVKWQPSKIDEAIGVFQKKGLCSIEELRKEMKISSRYLRKIFQHQIGLAPKTFIRICRFNSAFQMFHQGYYNKLSDIAYQMGYFDQSHFIKDFKHFTGSTPSQFQQEEHPLHRRVYWRDDVLG